MWNDFELISDPLNIELFGVVFLEISVLIMQMTKRLLGGE
jgi:hypothetical protein